MLGILCCGDTGIDAAGDLVDVVADVMDLRAEVLDFLGGSGPDRSPVDEPDDISPFTQPAEFGLTAELLILLRRQLNVQMVFFFWEPQAFLLSAALPQTFRPQAALGSGVSPASAQNVHLRYACPTPPLAALARPRRSGAFSHAVGGL